MTYLFCATLLTAVILGAHGFPADPSTPLESQPTSANKQLKQSLFGSALDINVNTNGTMFPNPAFINFNTSMEDTIGGGASIVLPLVPFPFGLIFPRYPPLNLTVGFNAGKNMSIILNAAAGDNSTDGSSTSTEISAEATIGKKKASAGITLPNRPNMVADKPKPSLVPKPQLSIADAVAAASNPDSQQSQSQVGNVMVENAVNSQVTFTEAALEELAAAEEAESSAAQDLEAENSSGQDLEAENSSGQDLEAPSVLTSESDSQEAAAEIETPQAEILNAASDIEILVPVAVLNVEIPVAPEQPQDLSKNPAKSRRHAGVERPSALRIEDFEDVEVSPERVAPPSPATLEEMTQDVGKEEMILMAMEQGHQIVPGIPINVARPAALLPGLINPKPIAYQPFQSINQEDEDSEEDVKNSETPELSLVGQNGIIPKVPTITKPTSDVNSGKNKPRPYGMDPAKNKPKGRPTLESGVKEKEPQHFGLPHYGSDLVHKEQMEGTSQTVLGWQLPTIKWPSFTNLFQNILGNRHKGLAKSEQVDAVDSIGQPCVDDDDDIVKSTVIQGGHLCNSGVGGVQNSCETQCKTQGFGSGNCLGPYPTPGCLCSMPGQKEYGLMLTPLALKFEDLQTSEAAPCRKCGCRESCQKSGSYLGYCVADRCHCAVPWYKGEA